LSAGSILDSLADGAYITDTDRNILFWNRAAERITGWTRGDVVGRACRDNLLVHIDKDGHALCGREYCPLHRAMVTAKASREPVLVFAQGRDGRRIPVEVSVSPMFDAQGRIVGGIEVFRDMSGAMEDMERAATIQHHVLESTIPSDPRLHIACRYIPESLVGGDFYRVERIAMDSYAVMVADVSGHGVAAALYTMQIRSLWEEYRHALGTPSIFLAALNHRLHALASREDHFATATHLVIDARTGSFSLACAGHPPPLLKKAGGRVASLEEKGPALGMMEEAHYTAGAGRLEPGESILLYTDGAVEIFDAEQRELGEAGLARLMGEIDLAEGDSALAELEEALLTAGDQVRLADDLTLVSIHRPRGTGESTP
jgi:PAS domain S-box-containing protein